MESREFIRHCRYQNLDEVKACLSRGVDINTVTAELIASIEGGHTRILNILVQQPNHTLVKMAKCDFASDCCVLFLFFIPES